MVAYLGNSPESSKKKECCTLDPDGRLKVSWVRNVVCACVCLWLCVSRDNEISLLSVLIPGRDN